MNRAGNVYIADSADNAVFKVTPAGVASVVASGLNAPSGVAVDPTTGNVDIADTGNHEVKQLSPGGALSVIAGTGTAGSPAAGPATASALDGPSGLAVDSAGNLYIADGAGAAGGNPFVEKVTPGGTLCRSSPATACAAPRWRVPQRARRCAAPRAWPSMPAATCSSPTPAPASCSR